MSKYDDVKFSKNVSSYLTLFIVIILVVILIVGIISAFLYIRSGLQPVDEDSTETIEMSIEQGYSASDIGDLLESEGIVKNGTMFELYLRLNSISSYQAGTYQMSPAMDFEQIARTLETGTIYEEVQYRLTVPEGYTIEEIAGQIESNTPASADEFLELMNDEEFIDELISEYPEMLTDEIKEEDIKYALEGYLYPATYDITTEEPDLKQLVRNMLNATKENSYNLYTSSPDYTITYEGESRTLTFHEFLTFSSLIEEEATSLADRSRIASVFLNRMASVPTMPLQTDPTVLYALGEHQEVVLYEDLEVDDPYNTYIHNGLTPGPIAAPGLESVQSTLNPSDTNYYYFLADSEGNNHFAETYEEHNENREKYIDGE
ncbi:MULTISPECIES: endolytic transglycosylase MltG [unclassified Jeotgalicoccus]|uniref:endolytic transglycosylase MltG n=1 Tax=unclassified Jeotgalicoccus TaxID=2630462 RepID=UPI0014150C7F|nr:MULTISPECIES: endolytic transglycosylase MltG [unclassified Jeotgalicoccus]QQD85541.1 endolytic transglycosylase MltG [Jeotgalicoccus sp. ATCC 8456]